MSKQTNNPRPRLSDYDLSLRVARGNSFAPIRSRARASCRRALPLASERASMEPISARNHDNQANGGSLRTRAISRGTYLLAVCVFLFFFFFVFAVSAVVVVAANDSGDDNGNQVEDDGRPASRAI